MRHLKNPRNKISRAFQRTRSDTEIVHARQASLSVASRRRILSDAMDNKKERLPFLLSNYICRFNKTGSRKRKRDLTSASDSALARSKDCLRQI